MNIDIKKIENIRKELENLDQEDVLFVDEDGHSQYVIMPIEQYEFIESFLDINKVEATPNVKIIGAEDLEMTYDQYENVKRQLNEIFEKVFKPKPEKLN